MKGKGRKKQKKHTHKHPHTNKHTNKHTHTHTHTDTHIHIKGAHHNPWVKTKRTGDNPQGNHKTKDQQQESSDARKETGSE